MKGDPEPYFAALGRMTVFLSQGSRTRSWPAEWNYTPKPPSDEDIKLIHMLLREDRTRTRWTGTRTR